MPAPLLGETTSVIRPPKGSSRNSEDLFPQFSNARAPGRGAVVSEGRCHVPPRTGSSHQRVVPPPWIVTVSVLRQVTVKVSDVMPFADGV
ncbi:MAG: hypothetical protein RL531_200 [Actinomycetota bacterium]